MIIELIGPAGSGKTTLSQALQQQGLRTFEGRVTARKISNVPFFIETGLQLLPIFLRVPGNGRWYGSDDISRMFYLTGMHRVFRRSRRDEWYSQRGSTVPIGEQCLPDVEPDPSRATRDLQSGTSAFRAMGGEPLLHVDPQGTSRAQVA